MVFLSLWEALNSDNFQSHYKEDQWCKVVFNFKHLDINVLHIFTMNRTDLRDPHKMTISLISTSTNISLFLLDFKALLVQRLDQTKLFIIFC